VYSPPPASYLDNNKLNALTVLSQALRMPREYIIVRDFNLYYSLWGGSAYRYQHTIADALIETIYNAGLELALLQRIITREVKKRNIIEQTTIDLAWLSATLASELI
jgi:hypothetical protein